MLFLSYHKLSIKEERDHFTMKFLMATAQETYQEKRNKQNKTLAMYFFTDFIKVRPVDIFVIKPAHTTA